MQQEDDRMLRKAERIKWMSIVSYSDVHSNGEQHQFEGAEHVEIEPDHQEDSSIWRNTEENEEKNKNGYWKQDI